MPEEPDDYEPDQPDQCCECDQASVGYSEGQPYCAEHYRRRPSVPFEPTTEEPNRANT